MAGDFWLGVVLTLVVPLALPFVAIEAGGGGPVRTVYPAYVLLVAGWVISHRRPLYPAFMLAVFVFAPFVRRVADYQAGPTVLSLVLLAPWIGLLPTLPALLRRSLGRGGLHWPFAVITICVVYAAFVAAYRLALVAAGFEGLRWLLPTGLCAFIMARPDEAEQVRRAIMHTLCWIIPVLTVYGIYQFVVAPPWDVFWMMNIDNATFGRPEPYAIRVFSTLNSPGTAGVFCSYALVLLAGGGLLPLVIAASGLPLLVLTLVRTAWISVAVGLVVLLVRTNGTRRLLLAAGLVAVGLGAVAVLDSRTLLPPEVHNLIIERLDTMSNGSSDVSAVDRLQVYYSFFDRLADNPMGEGLGANAGTASTQSGRRDLPAIDSGLLEAYLTFGVVFSTLYFGALAVLMVQAGRCASIGRGRLHSSYAVIWSVVANLPLGSNQIGEVSVLPWIVLGLLFAQAQQTQETK